MPTTIDLAITTTAHTAQAWLYPPGSEETPPRETRPASSSNSHHSIMPNKNPGQTVAKCTHWTLWFNLYRKLFAFTLTLNLIGIALASTGFFPYARAHTGAFVLGNLLVAVLVRNEVFGRCLYLLVNTLFAKWPPLIFRRACTSLLQHLGGIHSGCALSGFLWLILRIAEIVVQRPRFHPSILIVGVLVNVLVAISVLSAVPYMRNSHHDVFEKYHRFAGWIGLSATWLFVLLIDLYVPETHSWWYTSPRRVFGDQQFWFTLFMTAFVAIPWLTVRKVPVEVEVPSSKVAVIRFGRGMQQGLLGRIGRSSLKEYHAFGIVSEGKDAKWHYMICGVHGDFTRKLAEDPPRHIWTRELKFAGVSNTSTLYRRGVRIATGTGIGAALSTCLQSPDWFLIWICSDADATFGPTVLGLVRRHIAPERMLLWDSKARGGRPPDVVRLVRDAYHAWRAEVVFITSNVQGNAEIMRGCHAAGIPAFGTLWDF